MTVEFQERKSEEIKSILSGYLEFGDRVEIPPRISLRLISKPPEGDLISARSVASSTAIQCYAPGVAKLIEREDEKAGEIAQSTLDGGHHTTRMHTNYTFQIVGATRSVTHDVFNATPFYNTEQQSQRYVEARHGNYLVPKDLDPGQIEHFKRSAEFSNQAYFQLLDALKPKVEERVRAMYPKSGWNVPETKARLDSKIQKLSQEIARYVLPIGQFTTYFYTINELQLLRMFRASQMPNFTSEARLIVAGMINEVAKVDDSVLKELDLPLTVKNAQDDNLIDPVDFDANLNDKQSKLVGFPQFGKFGPKIVFDQQLLADVFESGMFDSRTSSLREVWLTFATKISHAGDSQRQRHRRIASFMPDINSLYAGKPDFAIPLVIRENPALSDLYNEMNNQIFENVDRAINLGIPREHALLLLPNSLNVRVFESGDLFDWIHRWKQRLCFLAQEEIFFVSVDQVKDLADVMPNVKPLLMAPCGIRKSAGVSPRCSEGSRYCGQPVFNWQIEEYKKHRLI